MEVILAIAGMIALVVTIRLVAGSFDDERVEGYVAQNGWELVDSSWAPFGPGWFGEQDARIHQIVYRDRHGNLHRAHVKTSMLSGVYFTNDQIVEEARPSAPSRESMLEEENRKLRERIRELEDGRS